MRCSRFTDTPHVCETDDNSSNTTATPSYVICAMIVWWRRSVVGAQRTLWEVFVRRHTQVLWFNLSPFVCTGLLSTNLWCMRFRNHRPSMRIKQFAFLSLSSLCWICFVAVATWIGINPIDFEIGQKPIKWLINACSFIRWFGSKANRFRNRIQY